MKPTNYVVYKRVSTDKQGIVGLGMQAQESAIQSFISQHPASKILASYSEVETGTGKRTRPMLKQALSDCKTNNATLIVATLSRLARNVHFISGLVESNVNFIALDMPNCDKTMLYLMSTIAEWEADTISKRVKAALQVLKDRGVKLGPKFKPLTAAISEPYRRQLNERKKRNAFEFADRMYPTLKFYKDKGLNNLKIAEELNLKQYKTPSGKGKWASMTVDRCLKRVGNQ
jgi:DNA invertase Pin-like site-specific DNA recombinase